MVPGWTASIAMAGAIPWPPLPLAAQTKDPVRAKPPPPPPPFPEEVFRDSSLWDSPAFVEAFLPRRSPSRLVHRYWPAPLTIFDCRPHQVIARFEGDPIEAITVLFLDSGTHFGYIPRSEAKQTEAAHQEAFQALYATTFAKVTHELELLSGGSGSSLSLGSEPMLTQRVTLFQCGSVVARLHAIEEQLIKVTFFRDRLRASHWIDPEETKRRSRERIADYARKVQTDPGGDILLENIPLLPQGDRAYCGVSALAMGMQHLGLKIDTEDYAAAAGIRYGSTRGSHIREVYEAAAEEAGMRMSRATRLDPGKVRESIRQGLPVLVWRRWTQERDYLHSMFARKHTQDPSLTLPEPDADDRATWPDREAYNHASVITGFNENRKEVIFSESWSEQVRNRRMRIEEMEATAYYTFLLRL